MSKILFVVPDQSSIPFVKEVLNPNYPFIEVAAALPAHALKLVQGRIQSGVEIVVARTITASVLKQAQLNISVVEIPRTSLDILRALDDAKAYGKKIAFIAYSEKIWGIDLINDAFGVSIRQYTVSYKDELEKEIRAAYADGADLVLGGVSIVRTSERLGIPCAFIKVGSESLLQAAREAMQIQQAREMEIAKRDFFGTILDYSYEGIVTVDKDHAITAFSPLAQKLTKISKNAAIGQAVGRVFPQLQLDKVVDKRAEDLQRIISVGNARIMCNKIPIIVNDRSYGAVATFQDIGKIQEMEAKIRQQIYAQGHTAKFRFADIVGKSAKIIEAIETAKDFAATSSNILLRGETGTGKEIFAQSIHNAGPRAAGPFVAINCAALPSQILESELFGYVAGAFTGANREGKPGLFEVAHHGTIFLDEIGEMDYINQGRLLRFLQEKTVVRLGSYTVIPTDVRIIAATNKDLEQLIDEKKFRDDLYYRLNVLNLELPPLRERREDIPLFARVFLKEFSAGINRQLRLSPDVLELFEAYYWPGNIREIRNVMERITASSKTDVIDRTTLSGWFKPQKLSAPTPSAKDTRTEQEIRQALDDTRGNYVAAAKLLGINRTTLWRRMQRLQIEY
ncbi:MAG: sigma 54-interacting transcriptional regulator [Negativicutes bacterium]